MFSLDLFLASSWCLLNGVGGTSILHTKVGEIVALLGKVCAETGIFVGDGILVDVGKEEESKGGGEEAEAASDPEGILGGFDRIVTSSGLDVREDPCSDESTNLANGSGDTVVATADTSGASLGGEETDVVTGAKLTEGVEDAVEDGEAGNVLGDLGIDTGHDEADDGLDGDTDDESILGADPVGDEGTDDGTGDVEQVDDGVPAKNGRVGLFVAVDTGKDSGRVDTEGVGGEL